ncbi:MAG: 3-oxoacyl-ACP reductase FabG [Clostridia bacterium]|nr:3-oxoacyl-ACP reductase FabG [Clostridia bacterium]
MSKMKVIITGGSRGIGAACVSAFANLGANVAFIYRSSDDAANSLAEKTGAYAIKADLSDALSATEAVIKAIRYLGGVDVLVNNAGVSSFGLLSDLTTEEYYRVMDTNLTSAVFASKAVLGEMIRNKSGSIINISSMWGEAGSSCEVVYSASKAGMIGFTKALAKELGPSGIRVNCITPGVIDTEMNSCLTKDVLDALAEETPLGRIGKAEEIADSVLWLASDKASFITGQVIGVNGGMVI